MKAIVGARQAGRLAFTPSSAHVRPETHVLKYHREGTDEIALSRILILIVNVHPINTLERGEVWARP